MGRLLLVGPLLFRGALRHCISRVKLLKLQPRLPHQGRACAGSSGLIAKAAREQTGDSAMGEDLKYQLRLTLSEPFAKVARNHPDDPSLAPLSQVLHRHNANVKCQHDAFADYVREAEANGVGITRFTLGPSKPSRTQLRKRSTPSPSRSMSAATRCTTRVRRTHWRPSSNR